MPAIRLGVDQSLRINGGSYIGGLSRFHLTPSIRSCEERDPRGAGANAAGQVERAVPGNFGRNTASRPIAGRNAQT
jgi:hypothetical protein